jgi:type IV pilus assembly protein PilQ
MQSTNKVTLCAVALAVFLSPVGAQNQPQPATNPPAAQPPQGQQPQGQPPQGQNPAAQGQGDISTNAEGDRASRLTLKLKDRDLRDVVTSIRRKANVNIIMDPAIEESVTIELQDVHWRQALDLVAEQAKCVVTEGAGGVIKVEKPPRVYFAFENTDIQKVIDTIAKISGANIVVAPEVKGNITLRLKDIPWRDALESAVKTLGFVVVQEDRGILRVVPASNIQQDLELATFQLRYVRPKSTYIPFIKSEYVHDRATVTPVRANEIEFSLLDALKRVITKDVGQLDYFDELNVIVVKDTRPVVEEIRRIITQIDTEPAQVFLDVKFVTTSNDDVLNIGVSPGGDGLSASLSLGQIPTRLPFNLGSGGWDDHIIANDSGTGPFVDGNLNQTTTTVPNVVFGTLNFQQVSMTLHLLKKDTHSEILQAPKVVALDHQTATIFVGEAVRYAKAKAEQGQAGGFSLSVEEGDDSPVQIGFQLLTTPHIVPGTDKMMLEVIPQRTALTGTGATTLAPAGFDVFTVGAGNQSGTIALPRVASSTIATKVMLRSAQTAVLGGLVTHTQTDTETKLPLLGDIPVLGYLFKNKATQDTRSTLIVFITPNLIRSADDTEKSMQHALQERFEMRQRLMQERDAIFGKESDK